MLAIYTVSGYWDIVLQLIVNAVVDAATVIGVSYALSRVLRGGWAPAAVILCSLIAAVPMSGDSILMGFQTQFYVLLALAFTSLWLLADAPAWSLRWALGAACAVASYLAMASGALTFAAAAGLHLAQIACGRRQGPREWAAVAALAAAAVLAVGLVPHVPETEYLRPHSLGQFLSALMHLASWPAPAALALLMILPSALFCLLTFRDRPILSDPRWFNVAAFGWIVAQMVVLAAGRGAAPVANRYVELLLLGVAIDIVSVFWLLTKVWRSGRRRPAAQGLGLPRPRRLAHPRRRVAGARGAPSAGLLQLPARSRRHSGTQPARLSRQRRPLASRAGAPGVAIPYPDPGRLRELLDTPEIRAALPPALLSRDAPRNGVEAFKRTVLANGFVWIGAGVLLLAVWAGFRVSSSRSASSAEWR